MTDTPPHVENLQREMLMRRSGAERMEMGAAMFEAARRIVRASLGDPDGRDDSADMRVKVFLRVYGLDFDSATRERIVVWLRTSAPSKATAAGVSGKGRSG
jgi:head-tail adaptor